MEDALKQKEVVAPGELFAQSFAAVRRVVAVRQAELVCALLLLLMAANLLASISRKSITNDEIVHIPAGYYHLVAGDFQLNNEHPPLIKVWAALPLLLVQPDEPPTAKTENENFMERTWGFHERFWRLNQPRFQTVTFWPRVMMVPLTLALGVAIFSFARKLFGEITAVIAVALFVMEPTMLAHGRVVHTDVPAALVYLLFFMALHYYHQGFDQRELVTPNNSGRDARGPSDNGPSHTRAVLLGLACALALLTKFSMLIVLPVVGIYFIARLVLYRRDQKERKLVLWHGGLIAVIVLFLINALYYFQHPPLDPSDVRWVALKTPASLGVITTALRIVSKIIPTYYLFGIYNIEIHNYYGHATYLLGQYGDLGWWYYFPVAFALKTTLPFLLLAIAGFAWAVWGLAAKRDLRLIWLIVPIAIYAAISLTSHINIGIRHFLPVYPFLFIAGGALLAQLIRARRTIAIVVCAILLGWMGIEAARAFPDYTPYMNQLASSHPPWYYLSDSNVEWGDDVGELAAYLKARGETRVTAALSAGWSTLGRYDVEYLDLVKVPKDQTPETRYVAIGAGFLNGSFIPGDENVVGRRYFERMHLFERYRNRRPEAVFGNSIYLFREHE